ncbi:Nif3-like dinuclear metal center hexameric protein [Clostridium culturomicium]|uniref:Nif3-like dinuclear metal center hexameric protein n=1 Tax=Clostridium culturomicium TaxID=1499683 RepID=UPI00058BC718|nr:Nif3-like dinuclear metal center hexameric protein [Clostridium culturomicium]
MKIDKLIKIMETIAPPNLKESYDNVGLMVGDREADVAKILVALDCTLEVIEEAKALGADLILSHHPLLFRKPSTITTDTLLGRKIIELIKNDIALYSSHTNWDSVSAGINDEFVAYLGFGKGEIMAKNPVEPTAGIGRMVNLDKEMTLSEVIETVKEKLDLNTIRFAGDLNKTIKSIAFVNGSGQDFMDMAAKRGADLIITGDTTYHFVSDYSEMGLCIMDVGHFNSEWPIVVNLSKQIKKQVESEGVEVVISKKVRDPYNFY